MDALEAVLGAMYIDGGLEDVRRVIVPQIIVPELERVVVNGSSLPLTDFKSALQERLQAMGRSQPAYVLVKEQGPEHSKTFTVEARLQTGDHSRPEFVGRAQGSTKKNAEQAAAQQLLDYLRSVPVDMSTRTQSRRPVSTKS